MLSGTNTVASLEETLGLGSNQMMKKTMNKVAQAEINLIVTLTTLTLIPVKEAAKREPK